MRRLVSFLALVLVVSISLAPAVEGLGGHCDGHHGESPTPDHGTGHHAAPPQPDECDHCPPTECTTASPCAGTVLAVVLRASAPLRELTPGATTRSTTDRLTSRAPEPTYPPPRLA